MSRQAPAGRPGRAPGDVVILSSGCSGQVDAVVVVRDRRVAVVFVCQRCGRRHASQRGRFERLRIARRGLLAYPQSA